MKRIVRSLIFLAIVFFLVSGSYGKTVSVSGSGSQGGGFVSIDIAASKDSSVNGNVVVSGGTVTPSISTKGRVQRFEVTHQVTDSTGKHAEVYAKVVNGQNIQYSSKVQPREGKLGAQFLSFSLIDCRFLFLVCTIRQNPKNLIGC